MVSSSRIQILFVDDDLEFSWLVVSYVKKRLNVPVRVAQSYGDATTLIGGEKYDMIICGLEKPELSSSLFRFAEEHSPGSRFVLFTSNDEFDRGTLQGSSYLGHVPKNQIARLITHITKLKED